MKTAHYFLIVFFIQVCSFGQNQARLDSLDVALKNSKEITETSEIYVQLIKEYQKEDLAKALDVAEQFKQFAKKEENNELLDKALRNIYNCSVLAGDLEKTEATLQELQNLYDITKNSKTQNAILSGEARLFLEKSEYKQAIEAYQNAIKSNEENLNNDKDFELYLAANQLNYAIALMSWGHTKKATKTLSDDEERKIKSECIDLMKQSLAFRLKEKDITEASLVYSNLAVLYRVFPNKDSVFYYSKKALDLAKSNNDSQKTAIAYTSLATFYSTESNFDKALDYLNKALVIYQQLGDQKQVGNVLCEQAKNFIWKEQFEEAKTGLEKAYTIFESIDYKHGIMMAESLLKNVYEEKKDFKNALLHYENYISVQTEILSEKNMKDIAWVKAKYDSENRERKIAELYGSNLEKEKKIKQNFYTILLLIATIIIVALLVIVMMLRNKNKNKKIEIEKQEILTKLKEEELKSALKVLETKEITKQKIAYELHDRLGVMLATIKLYVGIEEEKSNSEKTKTNLTKSLDLLQTSINEVRAISSELASPTLEKFGINMAINELVRSINQTNSLTVEYTFSKETQINAQLKINIYRIVQELLSNAIKHSKANEIHLKLENTDKNVVLTYTDNGIGFSETQSKEQQNVGWKSIYTRLNQEKAEINFFTLEKGTKIIFTFPNDLVHPKIKKI